MNASGFGMVPTATSHGVEKASVLTHLYSAKFRVYSPIYYVEFLSRSPFLNGVVTATPSEILLVDEQIFYGIISDINVSVH